MRRTLIIIAIMLLLAGVLNAAEDNIKYNKDILYTGEKSVAVVLDFGMAELKLAHAGGDFIARIEGEYDQRYFDVKVDYVSKNGSGVLEIKVDNKKKNISFSEKEIKNDWKILLGDKAPLELSIDAGMAAADFDFTGLTVNALDIDVGMASGSIIFNKPNPGHIKEFVIDAGKSSLECYGLGNANFDRLVIDAGMASATLDFSGQAVFDGVVEIDAGMSSASITLNPAMGNMITCPDSWTSSVDIPSGFEIVKKGVYRSSGYDSARGHLQFDIDVSMGSVDFDLAQSL